MEESLIKYIEETILPMYDDFPSQRAQSEKLASLLCRVQPGLAVKQFDAAHRRDHVDMVIGQSMEIARGLEVNQNMVYAIAAYHDTGLVKDRKIHHLISGEIIRKDVWLKEWFSDEQIEIMAQAVEDHRASSDHEPRSIYGRIVAEADRFIDPDNIILRTVQYGLANFPELDKEGQWLRTLDHLHNKYAEGGYLRLWFDNSPNLVRLNSLREIINDENLLRSKFDYLYEALTNPHLIGCSCPQCQPPRYRKPIRQL